MSTNEQRAILGKALSFINKMEGDLTKVDAWHFPTTSSEDVRDMLLKVLSLIKDDKNFSVMDPIALYNRLFSFLELVETLKKSSSDRISWPLVRYCDIFWHSFFPDGDAKLFYSLMDEYNYSISNFSSNVEMCLDGLLPSGEILNIINHKTIYCLHLSSIEDANLPLYAIIGHEFGHVLFDHELTEFKNKIGLELKEPQYAKIFDEIMHSSSSNVVQIRRIKQFFTAIEKISEELFSDMVGVYLMGPAFYLSLYEISWGQQTNIWSVELSPRPNQIRAYPSLDFRMEKLRQMQEIQVFFGSIELEFDRYSMDKFSEMTKKFNTERTITDNNVEVRYRKGNEDDAYVINEILQKCMSEMQVYSDSFLGIAEAIFREKFSEKLDDEIFTLSAPNIVKLIERLEYEILPNIIPDETKEDLLGRIASFKDILNASALFRLNTLMKGDVDNKEHMEKLNRIERLTAKAFEVSFVQNKFKINKKVEK